MLTSTNLNYIPINTTQAKLKASAKQIIKTYEARQTIGEGHSLQGVQALEHL